VASDATSASADPGKGIGPLLARMRKAKGLTGGQLGTLVGLSQSTISRLENGIGFPDPGDVARIAHALDADEQQIRRLVAVAERAHDHMLDWRPLARSLTDNQRTIGQFESEAKCIRIFQPAVIVGLLQTSEYARAVLASFQQILSPDTDAAFDASVGAAVSARVQRQELLADRNREFRIVMTEAVLSNRICPPEDMLGQIRRLREVARQDNVSLAIVPAQGALTIPPLHGFVLLDDTAVTVDLFSTGVTTRGKADARLFRAVFDACEEHATTDIDPILDRYTTHYLELLRAARTAT